MLNCAAALGCSEALFNLAEAAYYGKGQQADLSLAINLYEQAFTAGIYCAAAALGGLYESGDEDVPADHGKAVSWYEKGAREQDMLACFLLGRLLLDEASPAYEPALGLYWLQWAAMSGEVLATERLVELYSSAFGAPPDSEGLLLRFWQGLAASQGGPLAKELSR